MTVDFTKITIYELLALILATIALLIPLVQWAWKKWAVKPILKHYPTGRAFLFINKSGSYMQIQGVYEAQNKPISVKNITLKVVRKKDDKALNLRWSSFTSPVNQRIVGNYASTTEIAHPFRIDADNIVCAFTEFADFFNSSEKTFQPFYTALVKEVKDLGVLNLPFGQACTKYKSVKSYAEAADALKNELFWEIGQYEVIMEVTHGKETSDFLYEFEVNSENYQHLLHNIDETLLSPLKDAYRVPYDMQVVQVELKNK